MVRPLHKFVAKTVGLTLLSGLAFHIAMENAIATRPDRKHDDHAARSSGTEDDGGEDSLHSSGSFMMMNEEDDASSSSRGRERNGNDTVHNQNQAFRRFLQELDGKDTRTKIEDAARSMEYFMNPQSLDVDVKLKRTQRPGDPIIDEQHEQQQQQQKDEST